MCASNTSARRKRDLHFLNDGYIFFFGPSLIRHHTNLLPGHAVYFALENSPKKLRALIG